PCHRSACKASRPAGLGRRPPMKFVPKVLSVFALVSVAFFAGPARAVEPMSLGDDLVTPPDTGTETVRGALSTGGGPQPAVIYLRYADGTEKHTGNYDPCTGTVPPFECSFA